MSDLRPQITKYNEKYWSGLREDVLRMPRCRACGHIQYPMGPCCSACLAEEFDWIELSGRGKVYAYVVYHHAFHPSLAERIPYNVAEITLDEGVRILSNIVGIGNDEIVNDMPVQARFERIDDELTLLRFEPAGTGAVRGMAKA